MISATSRRSFPRHCHDQFGFGVIDHGAQRSASGRGPVEAFAGDVITVNPGEVHDGHPIGDHGRAWRMVYLDPSVVTAAMAEWGDHASGDFVLTRPVLAASAIATPIRALIATIDTNTATDDLTGLRRDHLLSATLAALAERRPRPATPTGIARARAAIDDDPAAPRSLDQLAAIAGMGRFQFARGFTRAFGLPPHAYVLQRRLHLARHWIDQGHWPLADIAIAAGFADQSHLTRLFTRTLGLSPGAYRRRD